MNLDNWVKWHTTYFTVSILNEPLVLYKPPPFPNRKSWRFLEWADRDELLTTKNGDPIEVWSGRMPLAV